MEIRKIFINGIQYDIYIIEYNGVSFNIGSYELGIAIDVAIENELYFYDIVIENGIKYSVEYLDNNIYCFLGEHFDKPTYIDVLDNTQVILDEYFN